MRQVIVDNISTSYFITEDGKCYNQNTDKYLKGQENSKNGYFSYNLTMPDGSKKRCYAHRMVAIAYLPQIKGKNQINHIDGNKLNNSVDNLEWCTQEENQQHAIAKELRKFKHVYCFTPAKELVAEYLNIKCAAKAVKVSAGMIEQEVNKDVKTLTGGFYWSYDRILGKTKDYENLGKSKRVNQYDLDGRYIMTYDSCGQAGRALGVKKNSHISECCRGKIKTYKSFVWRYADDIVSPSVKAEEADIAVSA